MTLAVSCEKLTGNPDEAGWAQAYEFKPEDEDKLKTRGRLFAVISTAKKLEQGVSGVAAGREILSRLHEEYFGKVELSAFVQLKKAIKTVIDEFFDWEDVEIAAIAYLGEVSYLVAGGGARIAILRNNQLTNLLQSAKGEVVSASGFPKIEDVLIAGTNVFFQTFPRGIIVASLVGKSLSESKDAFAPAIHSQMKRGNLGAILVKFEKALEAEAEIELEDESKRLQEELAKLPTSSGKTFLGPKKPSFSIQEKLTGLAKRLGEKRVYLKEEGLTEDLLKKRKASLSVGLVLILILIVSIFFGVRQKKSVERRSAYEKVIASVEHELEEAETLVNLNPQRSRELLVGARDKVMGLESEGVNEKELLSLMERIRAKEKRVLGEHTLEPGSFIDLSLISTGFKGDALSLSEDRLYVVDKDGKKIVAVSVKSKRTEIIAGPAQIKAVELIASYSDKVFYLNSQGVFETGRGDRVIDADWAGEVLAASYAGNFYIIDKKASDIYRYPWTEGGFGQKRKWLDTGAEIDLSGALSLAIDGSIWVLINSGEIFKFNLGNREPFSLSGVFPEIESSSAIYTDEGLIYLYLLEKDKGRVVVVSKEGEYKAQYISDKIKEASGLVVSESQKKIILLTSDKLLAIEIEHL